MKRKIFALAVTLILIICACSVNVMASEESIGLSAPIIQFPTDPTNESVTVTLTAADSTDSNIVLYYCIAQGEWTEYIGEFTVSENTVVSAKAVNESGEHSPVVSEEITCIDKIAPTEPTIVYGMTDWTKTPQIVTLISETDMESGYLKTEYKIGLEGTWVEYGGEFTVSDNCVIYARTVDRALNCSAETSISVENFDLIPPDISSLAIAFDSESGVTIYGVTNYTNFFTGNVTCTIDGATDFQSGIAYCEYQAVENGADISDTAWRVYDPNSKLVLDRDFIGNIYARVVDNLGNISRYIPSVRIVIDNTAPVICNVQKSTSAITNEAITVTFDVTDNISILDVTVNGENVGIYTPFFTVFRNGEYIITARDKAGNVTTETIFISNIQTTPFDILKLAQSLNEEDYTPTSWHNMQIYMKELDKRISEQSSEGVINAAAKYLTLALENLVLRGDRTYANELLKEAEKIDKKAYTDTSRKQFENAMNTLSRVLKNSESSQRDIDEAQATLENFISCLVPRADFTALDRIIKTVKEIDPTPYPQERYELLMSKVAQAEKLVRTDTDQETADRYYSEVLTLMGELNINVLPDEDERVKEGINLIHVMIVVVAMLAVGIVVAIVFMIKNVSAKDEENWRAYNEALLRREQAERDMLNNQNVNVQDDERKPTSFGDIYFGDDESDNP